MVKDTAGRLVVADKSRPPMTIVASGYTSDNREDQIRELPWVAETEVDAVILITNHMDIASTDDET